MRILKFRVWNGEQMVCPDYIDRNGRAWWKENSIPTSSDKVMQFTGLHDKNGREIWEGDRINILLNGLLYTDVKVIFNECCFCLCLMSNGNPYYPCLNEASDYEIIGNIWEDEE